MRELRAYESLMLVTSSVAWLALSFLPGLVSSVSGTDGHWLALARPDCKSIAEMMTTIAVRDSSLRLRGLSLMSHPR